MTWVNAIVQGILLGGLYALFACGLSLMFGVMEVINLAHGDMAVVAAYLAVGVAAATPLPPVLAVLLVVPIFFAIGYLVQRTLIQASLQRGALTTLLVTFGLSVVIENALLELFSADSHSINIGSLVSGSFRLSGQVSVAYLSVAIFAVAVCVLLGLQYFLSRTTTGRLIRAVADDREAAQLSGASYRRVFGVASGIAFATVAIAGVAFGMYSSFNPSIGASRLLFAFEAVVIGGLGSLWGTLIGGIVLGVAQAIGARIDASFGVLAGHLVFLAILAVRPEGLARGRAAGDGTAARGPSRFPQRLVARARNRGAEHAADGPAAAGEPDGPAQAHPVRVSRSRRPSAWAIVIPVAVVVALASLPYVVYSGTTDTLINLFILLTIATMWNLLAGYAGLVSVGQQAFIGLGAYAVLFLGLHSVGPFAAIPLAGIVCAAIALPVSWLVFRLRGGYFAIATWVVADTFELLVSRSKTLGGGTGAGVAGLSRIDPSLLTAYTYWASLAVAVLAIGGAYLLLRSRLGLVLTAVRDNEVGARSLGARVTRAKRIVFLVSAFGCGAAGALLAVSQLNVQPASVFSVQWSADMIFVTVIGGIGSIEGPIIGTVLFFALQQALSRYGAWYLIVVGVVAIGVAIWTPRGLWGLVGNRVRVRPFPVGYWLSTGETQGSRRRR